MTTPEAGPEQGPAFAVPGVCDDAELWLVRHGETEWSAAGRHTGRSDLPLTSSGEKQAAALRDVLAGIDTPYVVSSPRQRALETARLAGLDVDVTTEDLGEWDYGDYEGRTTDAIRADVPGWTIWTHGAAGGETVAQVGARADRMLASVADRLGRGPLILVGHGHFSRVLGARWLGHPASGGSGLLLGTAATAVLGAEHGAPALRHWNLPNPARS